MREGPWMANPGSLAVYSWDWGHIGIPPSQGAVAPQTQLGGPTPGAEPQLNEQHFPLGAQLRSWASPRGSCCSLTLTVLGMPTACSGATGEDATKPAAPWDSSMRH